MTPDAAELDRRVLAFIRDAPTDDQALNDLATALFAYQYGQCRPYRALCDHRGARPGDVAHWREIPGVPTRAFKHMPVACFPADRAVRVFHTSGTTRGEPGKHYLDTLTLYEAAIVPHFRTYLLPDGERLPMLALTPPPGQAPHSSLSHMMGVVGRELAPSIDYFVHQGQLAIDPLRRRLDHHHRRGEPVLMLGTAFALVAMLDTCREHGWRWPLHPESRAMPTGGLKGRSRQVAPHELTRMLTDVLGLAPDHVVGEYGMTEMSSQFYDVCLHRRVAGLDPAVGMVGPPWTRTVVVDPETLDEMPRGQTGILKHMDLANRGSAVALLTEDLGRTTDAGFELLGRAPGAEPRGCSLAMEDLLRADRDD